MWIMPSPSRNEFEGILGLMVDDMFKDMAAASPISVAEPIMVHHKGWISSVLCLNVGVLPGEGVEEFYTQA